MKKKTNENVIKDKQYFIQKKEYSDNRIIIFIKNYKRRK